jgi:pimeloyl-ACP methyl ester carboxylesterase
MDLSDDALAAIKYLRSRKDIDASRIGVWGLSQGGWLGPLTASRSVDVAFVIAVSGPGVSPGEQMIVYYANELRDQGVAESDVREASTVRRDIWKYMSTGLGYETVNAELEEARTKRWFKQASAQQDDSFGTLPTPAELNKPKGRGANWFKQEAVYDPVPALQALRVPSLFLFGDRDRLIPVDDSVAVIKRVQEEETARPRKGTPMDWSKLAHPRATSVKRGQTCFLETSYPTTRLIRAQRPGHRLCLAEQSP